MHMAEPWPRALPLKEAKSLDGIISHLTSICGGNVSSSHRMVAPIPRHHESKTSWISHPPPLFIRQMSQTSGLPWISVTCASELRITRSKVENLNRGLSRVRPMDAAGWKLIDKPTTLIWLRVERHHLLLGGPRNHSSSDFGRQARIDTGTQKMIVCECKRLLSCYHSWRCSDTNA
jgi:hypothetical protein